MKLKTYRARTMAEALSAVKKDLGRSAVILHTRMTRSGGFLGIGRKSFVEVTASDEPPARGLGDSRMRSALGRREEPGLSERSVSANPASGERPAAPVAPVAPARTAVAAYAAAGAPGPSAVSPGASADVPVVRAPERPSSAPPVVMSVRERLSGSDIQPRSTVEAPALVGRDPDLIRRELSDIKLLVNQVLQSSVPSVDGACGRMPEALFEAYLRLLESQVSRSIADRLVGRVRDELDPAELADAGIVRATVLRHLAGLIPVVEPGDVPPAGIGAARSRPMVIALVGPTGVGKTTTIAKLAATYRLRQGRSVALITADTYRIAAVDQLRTYASIIGLPMKVVMTPAEMAAAVEAFGSHDVILIDTAGRSQRNTERLSELAAFLEAARPSETHLVLSTAAAQEVLIEAAEAFSPLRPNRVILTKLDEAVHFGAVVNVMERLRTRLSFVTMGQEVPDHLEPGRPERLARLVLGEERSPASIGEGPGDRAFAPIPRGACA